MQIELDHPTLTYLLGYLTEVKWADAIRQKNINVELAWELLRIQDCRYNGNMVDGVKELVELSQEEWRKHLKAERKQ